ncbi:hypothetical protein MBM_04443 [Drepanopeziza brunnea f. sp. 'multigermtubi' MB_m1]|uniref:Uncharacterized protein n=1 Tax=Marssonina brunnea f. sp. multigermtubi (strain MB_m1) TaxID=1072389 RepID=K1WYC5_MARBU|nr:uncharacterized protein MBM_04443 [Drepanopeziza brunnea f. sp. 'multigermtubi' MB_m1]EKD17582.1 hypothetical protein MBM_04443 [Drepanopeziza brunnea f. sp. 'multigermtubi' MB_m1]
MAQSRPPPGRPYAAATSPPLSPRTYTEKKHSSRRRSGKDVVVIVSEKKALRPAAVTRKTAAVHPIRGGGYNSSSRSQKEQHEDEGRDSGESFLQFWYVCRSVVMGAGTRAIVPVGDAYRPRSLALHDCPTSLPTCDPTRAQPTDKSYSMTCEKQFLPADNLVLYCSDSCRVHDQTSSNQTSYYPSSSSPPLTPFARHFSSSHDDGPDIIPPFSPTQSRPRSYFNSDPYSESPSHQYSASPPPSESQSTRSTSSTALDSLRTLATALPRSPPSHAHSRAHPSSPPRSAASSASSLARSSSGVWDYIPFTGSKVTMPTPSATPGNSYSHMSAAGTSASSGRSREDLYAYGKSQMAGGGGGGGYGSTGGMGMDRPLPPRTGPSGYGHRPRSIDLVTPLAGY